MKWLSFRRVCYAAIVTRTEYSLGISARSLAEGGGAWRELVVYNLILLSGSELGDSEDKDASLLALKMSHSHWYNKPLVL